MRYLNGHLVVLVLPGHLGGRFHEFHCFVLIFISVWEVCLKKDQGLGVFIDIKMVLDSYSFFDE